MLQTTEYNHVVAQDMQEVLDKTRKFLELHPDLEKVIPRKNSLHCISVRKFSFNAMQWQPRYELTIDFFRKENYTRLYFHIRIAPTLHNASIFSTLGALGLAAYVIFLFYQYGWQQHYIGWFLLLVITFLLACMFLSAIFSFRKQAKDLSDDLMIYLYNEIE